MGVAFWILPRFRTWAERGDERPAFLASLLLNLGVIVAAVWGAGSASLGAHRGRVGGGLRRPRLAGVKPFR
jgi:hypothetical protein